MVQVTKQENRCKDNVINDETPKTERFLRRLKIEPPNVQMVQQSKRNHLTLNLTLLDIQLLHDIFNAISKKDRLQKSGMNYSLQVQIKHL